MQAPMTPLVIQSRALRLQDIGGDPVVSLTTSVKVTSTENLVIEDHPPTSGVRM